MSYLYKVEAKQVAQKDGGKFLGTASLTIGNQFKVTGIQIWEGQYGPYVKMPSYKSNELNANGKPVYKELFQAASSDVETAKSVEKELKQHVLEAFNQSSPVPGKEGEYAPGVVEYDSLSEVERKNLKIEGPLKISASMKMIPQRNGTIAYGSLRVGDFRLNSVQYRISVENPGHRYAAMPSYRVLEEGKPVYHDVGYPKTPECRSRVQAAVREAYERSARQIRQKQEIQEVQAKTDSAQNPKKENVQEKKSQEKATSALRSNNDIRQELRANGFTASRTLIDNIQRLDALTGKSNTLQDIKKLGKELRQGHETSGLSELSKDCVNDIVDELQQQEMKIVASHRGKI